MFIQTEPTPNPDQMKFLPGQQVMPSGTAHFPNVTTSDRSPLAKRLFAVEGVTGVSLDGDSITLSKADDWDWQVLKTFALAAIRHLDDMPAEAGFYRRRELTRLQGKGRIGEFGYHLVLGEIAQITTLGAAGSF